MEERQQHQWLHFLLSQRSLFISIYGWQEPLTITHTSQEPTWCQAQLILMAPPRDRYCHLSLQRREDRLRGLVMWPRCQCVWLRSPGCHCVTLYDSGWGMPCHGILLAGILEWVAISSSRGSFRPRDWTRVSWGSWIGRIVHDICQVLLCDLVTFYNYSKCVWKESAVFQLGSMG